MNIFKRIKQIFTRKPKFRQLESQELVAEAFRYKGRSYYTFSDAFKMPAGRGMAALGIYAELEMRCSKEYLKKHTEAMRIILSDPKKIDIQAIAIINKNLNERLDLAPFPDHILKLASVMFFDDNESPYVYDYVYNRAKIELWRKDPNIIDFFLRSPLTKLIPLSAKYVGNAKQFSQVSEMIDQLHHTYLSEQLLKNK